MKRYLPWLFAGFISLVGIVQAIYSLQFAAAPSNYISQVIFVLLVGLFAFIGVLIIVRQDGNRVGWLMMLVAISIALQFLQDPIILMSLYPEAPTSLTLGLWLQLWLQGWVWLLLPIGIFQTVLNFPDGRPPTARWNWINSVAPGTLILAALVSMFDDQVGPINNLWNVENPLGFFPPGVFLAGSLLWTIGLFVVAIGSLASLFVRFRRGSYVEREQIKWLLFAVVVIILALVLALVYYSTNPVITTFAWQDFFLFISVLLFPLAIGNAILRYRLYDIDVIIRRTLQYTLLTGVLLILYFLGVVILQAILNPLTGETNSPLVIVLTTLGIAALFNPLRIRVQAFIDRRFYRAKYSADQTLVSFAATARDEVDIERLVGTLLGAVEETMQPDHVSLWLKDETHRRDHRTAERLGG